MCRLRRNGTHPFFSTKMRDNNARDSLEHLVYGHQQKEGVFIALLRVLRRGVTTAEGKHSVADGSIAGNPVMASESKDEADGTEAELENDRQQEQQGYEGADDGADVSIDDGGAEGKGGGEGVSRNAEGKEADDDAGVGAGTRLEEKPQTHDDRQEALADNTPTAAAEGKGEDQQEVGRDQSGGGGAEPPLSSQQQQQQQQQHAPTTGMQDNQGDGAGGSGDGASNTPPAPLASTWPAYCDPTYRMPDELAVRVLVDGELKEMSIKVERFEGVKLFQGGYRHRGTGRMFHHASTQFGQRERPVKQTGHLRTRDTQTCKIKTTTMQTTNECGTQASRSLALHQVYRERKYAREVAIKGVSTKN